MPSPSIWVATSFLLEQARFLRQNFAVIGKLSPKVLAQGYSAAASIGDDPEKPDFTKPFSFYHTRASRLLSESESLENQGVEPNDLLVLIPALGEQAEMLAAMIEQTQGFPAKIDSLPLHIGTITMSELDKRVGDSSLMNNVTINLSHGSVWTGPLAVGREIQQAYTSAHSVSSEDLRAKLEELVAKVGSLIQHLPDDDSRNEAAQQLATFVDQAKKEKPSKRLLRVTGDGLIDAAKSVASLAVPIAAVVEGVLKLLRVFD